MQKYTHLLFSVNFCVRVYYSGQIYTETLVLYFYDHSN